MAFVRWNQVSQIWEVAANPDSPTTLFNHLPVQNPTQPLDIANKQYVDASAAPPGVYVPYTGAVNHVNLGIYGLTAAGLQINGNAGVSVNLNVYGRGLFLGGSGTGYSTGPLEIQMTSTPRVTFHWAGIVASQIGMNNAGAIVCLNNPGTAYENFIANRATFHNGLYVYNSHIFSAYYLYPGAVTNPNVVQSDWFLASHSSYGLYTNTGLYVAANVYIGALGGGGLGYAALQSGTTVTVTVSTNAGYLNFNFTNGVLMSVT